MYHRYHIETAPAPDIAPHPNRFRVRVKKSGLAKLILKELLHYRFDWKVVSSRPCMYGVFSGPVGGFAPREQFCVGCLRCTTEHPDFVTISPNPERNKMGDSYFTPGYVDAIHYECEAGRIPVRGAGYRGPLGGEGWDGMWTDMSEIVRPTRDGIHGREFISTSVDLGAKPSFLEFDRQGKLKTSSARTVSLPLPTLLDALPAWVYSDKLVRALSKAAEETGTLTLLPIDRALQVGASPRNVVPLLSAADANRLNALPQAPAILELDGWNEEFFRAAGRRFPESIVAVRISPTKKDELAAMFRAGVRVFHLSTDFHGRSREDQFMLGAIRDVHRAMVDLGWRDEATLVGSGGIIAAEHVAKAILCGLDAVALDTPILVALQARLEGECADRITSRFQLPEGLTEGWAVQRIKNLLASWRDQLLEMMGAMGMREVRRLRGEMGRAMFQKDLEREAFAGIEGYGA